MTGHAEQFPKDDFVGVIQTLFYNAKRPQSAFAYATPPPNATERRVAVSQAVATVTTMATTHANLLSPLDANSDSRQEALGKQDTALRLPSFFSAPRLAPIRADSLPETGISWMIWRDAKSPV